MYRKLEVTEGKIICANAKYTQNTHLPRKEALLMLSWKYPRHASKAPGDPQGN